MNVKRQVRIALYVRVSTDGQTVANQDYRASQCLRKRVEEPFGWAKTVGHIRQTVFRGLDRVNMQFLLTMAANNLVRMRGLLAVAT
jgi:DNA invertase Pin-like site-specific DNA recombinase